MLKNRSDPTMLKKLINKLYNNIRTELTSYQWHSFLSMVIGICITDGRKSLKALTYLASSTALSRFFNGDKWPSKLIKQVQRKLVLNLIKRDYWNKKGRNPTVLTQAGQGSTHILRYKNWRSAPRTETGDKFPQGRKVTVTLGFSCLP